jgi:hypothetical protein
LCFAVLAVRRFFGILNALLIFSSCYARVYRPSVLIAAMRQDHGNDEHCIAHPSVLPGLSFARPLVLPRGASVPKRFIFAIRVHEFDCFGRVEPAGFY